MLSTLHPFLHFYRCSLYEPRAVTFLLYFAVLVRQLLRQLCQACNLIARLQADKKHLASSMQIRSNGDIHCKI
jgi:hypothetical protein